MSGVQADSHRRVEQNRRYPTAAREILGTDDPRLAWLWHRGGREKVLEELGRIASIDQESCRQCAIELGANPPKTTHAGAAWLRHRRLGHDDRGDPAQLRDAILRSIRRFQQEHPATNYATIIAALHEQADEWEAAWRKAQRTA